MFEENIKIWGPFGELALTWCEAFMDDNDYVVLMIYLQKRKWIMSDSDLQAVIKEYDRMGLADMRQAAMNLQNFGIVRLDERKQNNFQRDNHFQNMQINNEFVDCLERQCKILEEKCQQEKKEVEKQEKNQTSKYCSICNQQYSLNDIHLFQLKRCKKYGCEQGLLIDSQLDELRKKHVQILEQILERIKRQLENCKLEPFPTANDIEQSKQMVIEVQSKSFLDPEVEKKWNENKKEQIHSIFKLPICKKINSYVQRKKQFLSNKMNIE
ncbi:unnamed protein product (macronuclear) [Paramecium tetraurelia]|uniref:Uncharacterized protein n=1 Tax=Paramecium tetraurelia TaxID=5888 RepID=A0DFE7_PARTE|nr:uncharacterized protein GSPATT00016577001 [Paramecium tetraurelia]CAK81764.1 unnamed protein product [Paramecium tetraurelia]|eukprot:XP_001449161.1 hypothetical protein (macronuclear) [Paramecium tetraurelia strain d4-2]